MTARLTLDTPAERAARWQRRADVLREHGKELLARGDREGAHFAELNARSADQFMRADGSAKPQRSLFDE